jgi:hypothetical protein
VSTTIIGTLSPDVSSSSPSKGTIAGLVGGVVGGVLFFGLCLFLLAWYKINARRRKVDLENSLKRRVMVQRPPIEETPSAGGGGMEQPGLADRDDMEQLGFTDEDSLEQEQGTNRGGMEQSRGTDEDSLDQVDDKDRGGMEQTGDDPRVIPLIYPDEISK